MEPIARWARWITAATAAAVLVGSFGWMGWRRLSVARAQDDRIPIKVLHWGEKTEDDIVRRLVADFEAQPENAGIRVVRINLGQAAAVRTKLQTMFAAGEPPDVFYLGLENVSDLAMKHALVDMEELIEADRAAGRETVDLDAFFPSVVRCFRVNEQTGAVGDGKLVGLPKDFTTVGFYYNRDLFKRAGVAEPPATGWTWEQFHAAAKKIGELPDCYGADFVSWEQMVRIYLWTHGHDFTSPGWAAPYSFNHPELQAAIQQLQDWFNDGRTLLSAKTQMETLQDPFLAGNVGMAGPFGRWKVPAYRQIRGFDWDLAPLPHVAGKPMRNGVFTVAWGISSATKHKDESWRFVKYLISRRGQELMTQAGLAVSVLRDVAEEALKSEGPTRPRNARLFLDAAEHALPTDFPAIPQFQQLLRVRLEEVFKIGRPVKPTLARLDAEWHALDKQYEVGGGGRRMPWGRLLSIWAWPIGAMLVAGAMLWWRHRPRGGELREERAGLLMMSPWVIGFMAFTAFPILLSAALAFTRWSSLTTLDQAEFIGWENFLNLWRDDATFAIALRKTAWYALLAVPSSQIVALAAAMLLNREHWSVGIFRSIWYLPGVLAGVGMAVMWKWVFHHEHGLLKSLLDPALPGGMTTPAFFEKDAEAWGVPVFALINLWAIGGTMMIYLAGLKGIPKDLYEAASIDGALGWRRFRHVTLPMLSPVIFFNAIMAIIASFQVFTQAHVMTGGGPADATRFYVVYLYNQAFDFHEMGYASAMAWLLLLIVLVLTFALMWGTKRFVHYEGLKA